MRALLFAPLLLLSACPQGPASTPLDASASIPPDAGAAQPDAGSPTGIQTLAGGHGAGYSGDGAPARAAALQQPGAALVAGGYVWICDQYNHAIRRMSADGTGTIETVAGGNGSGYSGDGAPAKQAQLQYPTELRLAADGAVVFADHGNHAIRRFTVGGDIETLAGGNGPGYEGDGAAATAAKLYHPVGLWLDGTTVTFADFSNHAVRRFEIGGDIQTIAGGNGVSGGNGGYAGDGGPAKDAQLDHPVAVAADADGKVLVADLFNHAIRRFTVGGNIETLAGGHGAGYEGDGAAALAAKLNNPGHLFVHDGKVLFSDSGNHAIRRFTPGGTIETLAGGNGKGYSGDGGPATAAKLDTPNGLSVGDARVVFADRNNHAVRAFPLP